MRIWLIIKLFCAAVTLGIVTMSAILTYHIRVKPVGGWPSALIPEPGCLIEHQQVPEIARIIESQDIPDIDPGQQAFQKAYELMVMGNMHEAREKLTTVYNIYPQSSAATTARRIVGEMNLDEILSPQHPQGKQVHTVQRGDSYLAIASHYDTSLDLMVNLNGMTELKGIQPGDKLLVMPLDFRVVVESSRKAVSLWKEGRFIREYPALAMRGVPRQSQTTSINGKIAEIGSERVTPLSKSYRNAHKVLQIASPSLQIRSWDRTTETEPATGILLRPQDMEELALLTRIGNVVEFR